MAVPLSSSKAFAALYGCPSSETYRAFAGSFRPSSLVLPRRPPIPSSIVAFARRRSHSSANSSSSSKKKKRSSNVEGSREEEDDADEDAFEKLFSMLAEDLKNDDASISDDIDDDISEEDFEKLQRELEEVLGIGDDDDVDMMNSTAIDVEGSVDMEEDDVEEKEDEDEEEEEERPVKLKNWQFRRLARALKNGRRKTSIKNLAAELCLDRAIVLDLLRDPPPNLVMMSATLPDEPAPIPAFPQTNPIEIGSMDEPIVDGVKSNSEKEVPVHVMRHSWSAQKRLKKVHVDTLERVYKRSKRPTNAMITSIVQVTNLPRKRVVKWFEDKRNEDGVPEQHAPFQRAVSEAVSS